MLFLHREGDKKQEKQENMKRIFWETAEERFTRCYIGTSEGKEGWYEIGTEKGADWV